MSIRHTASRVPSEGRLNANGHDKKPNVVYFLIDNLGMCELSSHTGGPFRGITTTRIDAFDCRRQRLLNFAPETQCTPSALMTKRYSIRSGNHTIALAGSRSPTCAMGTDALETSSPMGTKEVSTETTWPLQRRIRLAECAQTHRRTRRPEILQPLPARGAWAMDTRCSGPSRLHRISVAPATC